MFEKKTILFLSANPEGTDPINVKAELGAILSSLRQTSGRDHVNVVYQHEIKDSEEIYTYIEQYKPHVIHFGVHGNSEGTMALQKKVITLNVLQQSVKIAKKKNPYFRLLVLNACYSQQWAKEITDSNKKCCAVGTPDELDDEKAIAFSSRFYRSLGNGETVLEAFQLAETVFEEQEVTALALSETVAEGEAATVKRTQYLSDDDWFEKSRKRYEEKLNQLGRPKIYPEAGRLAKRIRLLNLWSNKRMAFIWMIVGIIFTLLGLKIALWICGCSLAPSVEVARYDFNSDEITLEEPILGVDAIKERFWLPDDPERRKLSSWFIWTADCYKPAQKEQYLVAKAKKPFELNHYNFELKLRLRDKVTIDSIAVFLAKTEKTDGKIHPEMRQMQVDFKPEGPTTPQKDYLANIHLHEPKKGEMLLVFLRVTTPDDNLVLNDKPAKWFNLTLERK